MPLYLVFYFLIFGCLYIKAILFSMLINTGMHRSYLINNFVFLEYSHISGISGEYESSFFSY